MILLLSYKSYKMLMEILGKTIRKNGFIYEQVVRNEHAAIYAQKVGGLEIGYEVFEIRQQKEGSAVIGGASVQFKAKELFPGDNEFGRTAWSCKKLADAQAIYSGLVPGWNKEQEE
jgi:hypothetical protein